MTLLHFVIYILRWVAKVDIRLLFKAIGWQTMNLVAGYKKLMEMYIALNIELVKVWLHGLACLVLVQ